MEASKARIFRLLAALAVVVGILVVLFKEETQDTTSGVSPASRDDLEQVGPQLIGTRNQGPSGTSNGPLPHGNTPNVASNPDRYGESRLRVIEVPYGRAAPGVPLRATWVDGQGANQSVQLVSDEEGYASFAHKAAVTFVEIGADDWRQLPFEPQRIRPSADVKLIHVVRTVSVEIELELVGFDSEGDDPTVEVRASRAQDVFAGDPLDSSYPMREDALADAGLAGTLLATTGRGSRSAAASAVALGDSGRAVFTARVPSLRGTDVVARAEGWIPDGASLDDNGRARSQLRLRLKRAPRVSGILKDAGGRVLPGVEVQLHATREIPLRKEEVLSTQRSGMAYGIVAATGARTGAISVERITKTNGQGLFEFSLPLEGFAVHLVAKPQGFRPARAELGVLVESRTSIVLVAEATLEDRVRIFYQGKLLANEPLDLVDVTDTERQESHTLKTDAKGTLGSGVLEHGRLYALVLGGHKRSTVKHAIGCFRWNEPHVELHIDKLPDRPFKVD